LASSRDKLDTLIAAFNRGSLDVPDGFLTPHTFYTLNGRSYESLLGGSPQDPLIRLLARGPAGYRTAAKALMYALQGPTATIDRISQTDDEIVWRAVVRVDGKLRPDSATYAARFELVITLENDRVRSIEVTGTEEDLAKVARARRLG
jgi:hypothetical protein